MQSPLKVLNNYPFHDGTLNGALQSRCSVKSDAPFLIQAGQSVSWTQFALRAERLAHAFVARGIRHGMRVAIIARNDSAHVLTLFALARLGAIMVPSNPDFGARELGYVLRHADVQGVVAEQAVLGTVRPILQAFETVPWLLVTDAAPSDPESFEDAINAAPHNSLDVRARASDTCIIIYTSGTTGFPKGVMHSQRNLVTAGEANVARLHLQPEDRILIILPFFHVNAIFYSLGGTLAAGACMILVPRFSASTFWQIAADNGATVVNVIDAIGTILCARDRSEYRPDHSLRIAYGVRRAAAPTFRKDFGIQHLYSGFGMSEIPGVTCNPFAGADKPGSMGMIGVHPDPARDWAQCRVVDDAGQDVAADVPGELWVRHPIVMQGYFRDPDQTSASFEDEWFKTGDIVRRDADGFFFHLSRKKDLIRRRGENISAVELETVIGEFSGVYECAAIAVPSELGEDDILLAVVLVPDSAATEAEIAQWCRDRLAAIKVPRYVVLLAELPHTPTHKIAKAALRADAQLVNKAVDFQRRERD